MKALAILLLAASAPALATDVAQVGTAWAVNLRQAPPTNAGSFGVRLTIVDPAEIQQHQVDSQAPEGSYANPVLQERTPAENEASTTSGLCGECTASDEAMVAQDRQAIDDLSSVWW